MVIGTFSDGVEALRRLAGDLPPELPAALFVVMHVPEWASSVLPDILSRAGPLKAVHLEDGDRIEKGRIYVAPPDFHLLVESGRVRLTRGPKENRHRPAVDPLFRTAAVAYGSRVVGVVLSGALNDGTAGLQAVKQRGGVAVVQDPGDALISGMPESALEYVGADHCLPMEKIAPLLVRLSGEAAKEEEAYPVPDDMELELGHAFTAESMLYDKFEELGKALYAALNTLEESALMADRLAARSHEHQHGYTAARFERRAEDARQQARIIRQVLTEGTTEAV
jgi:two-component system chemotaxis response regulator CheB